MARRWRDVADDWGEEEIAMPPTSKAQARFMRAAASGSVKVPGLSKDEAQEYVSGYSTKNLPERKSKPKSKKKRRGLFSKVAGEE